MKSIQFIRLTLALGAAVLVSSCALTQKKADFNPLTEFTGSASEHKLQFMKVKMNRGISSAELRAPDSTYRVGAGDVLQIEIVEVPDTLTTTIVMPDGKLYYDVSPGVPAVGKTIPQLEREIANGLKDAYPFPIVNINTVKVQSTSYSVMGQAQTPGVFQLDKPTTLLDAISMAGGIKSSQIGNRSQNLADLRRSVLIRNSKIIPVNFEALVERGDMRQNVYLRPNDYVFLSSKGTERVYVLGNVRNPKPVSYSSKLTFVRALAEAGGPAPSTYRSGLLLIRGATSPNPQVAAVNLHGLLKGKASDFHLRPGDVIWVPKAPWKKLGEYAQTAVDSAVSTIAIQEASNNSNISNSSSSSSNDDVTLDLSTGPES